MFTKALEIADRFDEAKKRLSDEGKVAIGEMLKEFFDEFPHVDALTWTQYTPYFNDGSPCTFNLGEFETVMTRDGLEYYDIDLEEVQDEEIGAGRYKVGDWKLYSYNHITYQGECKNPQGRELYSAIQQFTQAANRLEEVFQAAYGDHVEVTVDRTKTDIYGYDHD